METKKKQFKMPHTFVIIGIIILLAVLLTWIIPAGSYTRFENEAGIKVIDPNDFNYIDKTPVNPLEIPLYIVKAFIKRIDLMLVIMFAGGAFHILTKTGALHAVVAKMAKVFSTRVYLFLWVEGGLHLFGLERRGGAGAGEHLPGVRGVLVT